MADQQPVYITREEVDAREKQWPPGIQPITLTAMGLLGIGPGNKLYWDGDPIVTETRLRLEGGSWWLAFIGVMAALIAAVAALGSMVAEWLALLGYFKP